MKNINRLSKIINNSNLEYYVFGNNCCISPFKSSESATVDMLNIGFRRTDSAFRGDIIIIIGCLNDAIIHELNLMKSHFKKNAVIIRFGPMDESRFNENSRHLDFNFDIRVFGCPPTVDDLKEALLSAKSFISEKNYG